MSLLPSPYFIAMVAESQPAAQAARAQARAAAALNDRRDKAIADAIKNFQRQYSTSRPEITSIIELAGSIFDAEAAAEKAAKDIIEAEAKRKAEEKRKIEAEAYKQSVLTILKHAKHNFKEIGKEYVRWMICPKTSGIAISAIIQINGQSPGYTPTDFPIPETWNTHFEEGLIPFLPSCPFCKKQNIIHSAPNNILWVMCNNHYKWDPAPNKHYKYDKFPPRKPEFNHLGVEYCPLNTGHPSEGRWVIWDPTDPDGALAKKAAVEKEIADIEKAIAELQAKVLKLRFG